MHRGQAPPLRVHYLALALHSALPLSTVEMAASHGGLNLKHRHSTDYPLPHSKRRHTNRFAAGGILKVARSKPLFIRSKITLRKSNGSPARERISAMLVLVAASD